MPAWLIWLIIAGGLAAAEATSLTFYLLMTAGGAGAGAVAAAVGAPVFAQVLVAVLVTLGLVWLVRPVALRHLHPDPKYLSGTAALVGREAVVLDAVGAESGQVRLNGSVWTARAMDPGQDLPVGTRVAVVSIDGATAVVWKDPFA